jgi:uncharacterized protein
MDRRSISITASRCTPGAVPTESTSKGSLPPVIANDTTKASLPVNRLERHAGKLARAVLRGGGDGDTASLPDPPLVPRSRFQPRLKASRSAFERLDESCDVKERPVTIEQLLREKRDDIQRIAAKHGAYNVRVFGSVARGEARPESDVDLLIDVGQTTSSWFPAGLILDLEELLGRRVQVVTEKALNPDLRDHVLREAVPL